MRRMSKCRKIRAANDIGEVSCNLDGNEDEGFDWEPHDRTIAKSLIIAGQTSELFVCSVRQLFPRMFWQPCKFTSHDYSCCV